MEHAEAEARSTPGYGSPDHAVVEANRTDTGEARERALPEDQLEVGLGPLSESNFWVDLDHDDPVGIFVATYEEMELSTRVWVVMHFPNGKRVGLVASVDWTRDHFANPEESPGIGLKFRSMDPDTRALLREYTRLRPPFFHER